MCPPLKKEVSQSLITEIAAHHTAQAHRATVISCSRTDNNNKDNVDDPCQMTTTTRPSLDNDNDNDDVARTDNNNNKDEAPAGQKNCE